MATVEEVNQTFAEKGIYVEIPLPGNWLVKKIDILEKSLGTAGEIGLLLGIQFYDDSGRERSDLFYCQGRMKPGARRRAETVKLQQQPVKSTLLPQRGKAEFDSAEEARAFLAEAFSHLLQDKGYVPQEQRESALYFEKETPKGVQRFFVQVNPCCDDRALEKARELVELRRKHGSEQEYGLVVLAFPDSLGLSVYEQENWIYQYQEYLATHRIGLYGVDNQDPNRIYPFSVYPKELELVRYFMTTMSQWSLVRARYVDSKDKRYG